MKELNPAFRTRYFLCFRLGGEAAEPKTKKMSSNKCCNRG